MRVRAYAVVVVLVALFAGPGRAVGKRVRPVQVDVPPVLYVVQSVERGGSVVDFGLADLAAASFTPILDDQPIGTYGLAVHAATRRWALSFLQLSNGAPLVVDGKEVSKPSDVSTIVIGEVGKGVVAVLAGDARCTNAKTACFETPVMFLAEGAMLITESLRSSGAAWNRWRFEAGARPAPILHKTLTKAGRLSVSPDGTRAAYVYKDAIHVTAWPAQSADAKPAVVKHSAKPVAKPTLLMSDVGLFGDHVFYFRREPKEQKRGYIEAWDLKAKQAVMVFEMPEDFPMWHDVFLWSASTGSVLFKHDASFERGDVYAVSLADMKVRKVAGDVRRLLDVSADGRFVLLAAYTAPERGNAADNPEVLVVVDVATGKEVARAASGVPGARFDAARFVGGP